MKMNSVDCSNEGDVRLTLRATDRDVQAEGVPEVCLDREWRRICNSGRWTLTEAMVACRQLGFSDQGSYTLTQLPGD